jgi:major intracellular serine protease
VGRRRHGGKTCPDDDEHGTHVAGIIAAENNEIGVVGVAPECKIIPVKVLDKNGSGNESRIANGIKWATDVAKVDFICMSLGAPNQVVEVHQSIKYAMSKKVICFVAAGNAGKTKQIFYPANYPECIGIGSIDENLNRSFRNFGNIKLDEVRNINPLDVLNYKYLIIEFCTNQQPLLYPFLYHLML